MSRNLLDPAVLVLLLAAAARAQDVLVVDDDLGPGVDFGSLSDAVLAAGEGDTILVRAGEYAGGTIAARSLAIAADPAGADVVIEGPVTVRQLSAGQFLSLAGLRIDASVSATAEHGLLLEDNLGHVWIEDCQVDGPDYDGALGIETGPGVDVLNSAHVTLVRCEVFGGAGGAFLGNGLVGLRSAGSSVHVFDSRIEGGESVCDGPFGCAGESAPGVTVLTGTAFVEGSELRAGDPATGATGSALFVYGSNPIVTLFDTTMPLGDPPITILSGTVVTLTGSSRDFTATSPARAGQPFALDFAGAPGDLVLLLVGLSPADVFKAQLKAPLLAGSPGNLFALGVVPAGGALTIAGTTASMPPAFESLPVALQAAFVGPGGAMLSDPARLVLLNTGF